MIRNAPTQRKGGNADGVYLFHSRFDRAGDYAHSGLVTRGAGRPHHRPAALGDFASEYGKTVTGGIATAGTVASSTLALVGSTAAIPVVGIAVAGVVLALSLFFGRKGPQQKVASTHIVDDLEGNPQYGLQANLAAYKAGPHNRASQAAALAVFDQIWQYLTSTQGCGNPSLGDPGHACINDRARGGKWDWFVMYRDPIANDPDVHDDAASTALLSLLPGADAGTVSLVSEYWPLGLIALGLLL